MKLLRLHPIVAMIFKQLIEKYIPLIGRTSVTPLSILFFLMCIRLEVENCKILFPKKYKWYAMFLEVECSFRKSVCKNNKKKTNYSYRQVVL